MGAGDGRCGTESCTRAPLMGPSSSLFLGKLAPLRLAVDNFHHGWSARQSRRLRTPPVTRPGNWCADGPPHGCRTARLDICTSYRATWGGSGMTEARPGPAAWPPLWEREAEIADVVEAVKALRADASSGSLLVFSGEAGIGETALLAERRIAEARRARCGPRRRDRHLRSLQRHTATPPARHRLADARRGPRIPGRLVRHRRTRARHRRTGRPPGRSAGRVRRTGRGGAAAGQARVAPRPDPRRRALGRPGDPAVAGRVGRAPRRPARPRRGRPQAR